MGSRWTQVVMIVVVAVASAAAVAIAGITLGGGDSASQEAYQETVVNARNRIEFALAKLAQAQSLEELLGRLEEAAIVVDDAAVDLDQAGVADGFEDENDKLVQALGAFSSELSGTAETMRDPTFAPALPRLTSLSFKRWVVVNRILGDLKKQGIDVEPLARH